MLYWRREVLGVWSAVGADKGPALKHGERWAWKVLIAEERGSREGLMMEPSGFLASETLPDSEGDS